MTPDEALADAVEAEVRRRLATASRRDILERALADHGRVVLVADVAAGIAFVNGYGPEHLSIDVADPEAAVAAVAQRGLDLRRALVARVGRRLRVGREPRPADRRARARLRRRSPSRPSASSARSSGSRARAWRRSGPTIRTLAEAEGLLAHRDAVEARFDDPDREGAPAR